MSNDALLQQAEKLLAAEVDHLRIYNRLLEQDAGSVLAPQVAVFRDDQLGRIAIVQARIRTLMDGSEVSI